MFIGLPGFNTKFWMVAPETGRFQGIYQWASRQDAEDYSGSFAMRFMARRSEPGSISQIIIPDMNIYRYLENRRAKSS